MNSYVFVAVGSGPLNPHFINSLIQTFKHFKLTHENLETSSALLQISLQSPEKLDPEKFKMALMDISNIYKIDAAIFEEDFFRKGKKLVVFDMDSTLIQHEVIDEMALVYGIGDKVKLITERAMNGELNFDQALRERVALLKGLPRAEMENIYSNLKITPGVEKFIQTVRAHGYKTAIVSGGFKYFAEKFKTRLHMDYAFANDLDWDGEVLSGKVSGEIINAQKKAELLDHIAKLEKIDISQVVAVGDGANDLLMLAHAGLGVAFHAKQKVREQSRHQVSHGPMTTLLYFLGIPGDHT